MPRAAARKAKPAAAPAPQKSKLPPALAKRAAATATAAKKRALARAADDLALIARKKLEIADAFYEIGEALVRLRADGIPQLLGYASFAELCETRLELSLTRAESLVSIASRVRREDALRWGQDKTAALVEIANATSADDTPGEIAQGSLKLPGGKRLDVEKSSARTLKDLAKQLRAKRGTGSARGRTTTKQERALADTLAKRLVADGLEAKVAAVATKPGSVSKLRIELPADALAALRVALRGL
jgi:hypothetical protein